MIYHGEEYKVGSAVYLTPGVFKYLKISFDTEDDCLSTKSDFDSALYPESYRKNHENIKASNLGATEPFAIALIEAIFEEHSTTNESNIKLRVKKFYRPENTHKGAALNRQCDLNMLYYSEEGTLFLLDDSF